MANNQLKMIDVNGVFVPNVDCYRNLLVYLLADNGYEIAYLGAKWPWLFSKTEKGCVSSHKSVSHVIIKQKFDAEVVYRKFGITEDAEILRTINQILSSGNKLIVSIDPQNLAYIKYPEDEDHSIVVSKINDRKAECVDTIPAFAGTIDLTDLVEGIKNVNDAWYAYIVFPSEKENLCDEVIFRQFVNDISVVKQQYEKLYNDDICFSTTFADMIEKISLAPQPLQIDQLSALCKGKWGWHIDRNAGLFSMYMNTDYVSNHYGFSNCTAINDLIEELSDTWSIAYKQLYMASISSTQRIMRQLIKCEDNFEKIIKLEKMLINAILI